MYIQFNGDDVYLVLLKDPYDISILTFPSTVCCHGLCIDCCFHVVLTHCQIHDIPAALVVLYTTSSQSMSEQVAGFSPLLEHSSIDELNLATRVCFSLFLFGLRTVSMS